MNDVDTEKGMPLGLVGVDFYLGPPRAGKGSNKDPQLVMLSIAHFIQLSIASDFPLLLCRFPFNLSGRKRYYECFVNISPGKGL